MAERLDKYDEALFLGYIESDLNDEDRRRFEEQLREDPRLRNLVAQMLLDKQALRRLEPVSAPGEVMERVNQVLERQMLLGAPSSDVGVIGQVRWTSGRLTRYAALAAMVLLGGTIVVFTLLAMFQAWPGQRRDGAELAMKEEVSAAESAESAPLADADKTLETPAGQTEANDMAAATNESAAPPPATVPVSPSVLDLNTDSLASEIPTEPMEVSLVITSPDPDASNRQIMAFAKERDQTTTLFRGDLGRMNEVASSAEVHRAEAQATESKDAVAEKSEQSTREVVVDLPADQLPLLVEELRKSGATTEDVKPPQQPANQETNRLMRLRVTIRAQSSPAKPAAAKPAE